MFLVVKTTTARLTIKLLFVHWLYKSQLKQVNYVKNQQLNTVQKTKQTFHQVLKTLRRPKALKIPIEKCHQLYGILLRIGSHSHISVKTEIRFFGQLYCCFVAQTVQLCNYKEGCDLPWIRCRLTMSAIFVFMIMPLRPP